MKIIKYLSPVDKLLIRPVCRRFCELVYDNSMWTKVQKQEMLKNREYGNIMKTSQSFPCWMNALIISYRKALGRLQSEIRAYEFLYRTEENPWKKKIYEKKRNKADDLAVDWRLYMLKRRDIAALYPDIKNFGEWKKREYDYNRRFQKKRYSRMQLLATNTARKRRCIEFVERRWSDGLRPMITSRFPDLSQETLSKYI